MASTRGERGARLIHLGEGTRATKQRWCQRGDSLNGSGIAKRASPPTAAHAASCLSRVQVLLFEQAGARELDSPVPRAAKVSGLTRLARSLL
jgi:hypothetical protein